MPIVSVVSLVVMMVPVLMVITMVSLVSAPGGHRGQQAPVTSDAGPVAPGRRPLCAYVYADRAQRFRCACPGGAACPAVVIAFCKMIQYCSIL